MQQWFSNDSIPQCFNDSILLPLGQRNALAVVAKHVENIHRVRGNLHYLIPAVYDIAFFGDKNVFVVSQENALCASRRRRKAVKLQLNRRRRRGHVGLRLRGLLLSIGSNGDLWLRYVNKHPEDIPSIAF